MDRKIAVFDSGVGGISTLATLRQLLPNESFLYFADNLNAPYGRRSADVIWSLAEQCISQILQTDPKATVLACNTVTSLCVKRFRQMYPDRIFVGIQPAVKPAASVGTKRVLVFVTLATACSRQFNGFVSQFDADNIVIFPLFEAAGLIEKNCTKTAFESYLRSQICGMCIGDFSGVVLGCTHFVLMKDVFASVFASADIFDGNLGTANMTKNLLQQASLLAKDNSNADVQLFLTNDTRAERQRFFDWIDSV